ncbi:hypothetical protein [Castellaniella sp. S9]|uniref:hypothetical protein n=1 Tax=Castellaniella sp. S9 TaxID=2993652 RepID=UPI0022B3CB1C|nr:hypothetical protein [Castellaniella sp. S9]
MKKLIEWLIALLRQTSPSTDPVDEHAELTTESAGRLRTIAWGQRVSQTFRDRIVWAADNLDVDVNHLMAVIAFETAETFRADKRNMAGSSGTGLIQFMEATARSLGTTTAKLAAMTAEDQVVYVYRYLLPYKGRMKTLSDVYMAVLWPRAIGKPDSYVLWEKGASPTTYRQNAGLDANDDHAVTKAEAAARVTMALERGLRHENFWQGEVNV